MKKKLEILNKLKYILFIRCKYINNNIFLQSKHSIYKTD